MSDAAPRWWIAVIALSVFTIPLGYVFGYAAGMAEIYLGLEATVAIILGATPIVGIRVLAGFAFHKDRKHVAESGWTPSRFYYAMVLPTVGWFLSLVYLDKRRKAVGWG